MERVLSGYSSRFGVPFGNIPYHVAALIAVWYGLCCVARENENKSSKNSTRKTVSKE